LRDPGCPAAFRGNLLDVERAGGRFQLARWLIGSGLELGPGHLPFDAPVGTTVTYVDKLGVADQRKLFPELGDDAEFVDVDVHADFDVDGLRAFPNRSQDFVICSHVLEHLADPLGMLAEMHRVLKRDGLAVVLLPDRRRTFDADRASTSVEHLAAEHAASVKVVDDLHLFDFLTLAWPTEAFTMLPEGWTHDEFWQWHRQRSIHVHCWTEEEFDDVIEYCKHDLYQTWEIVDRLPLADDSIEFGYVLRKVGGRRSPVAPRRDPWS
jgi:SAM-dependent methyltransferase